MTGYCPFSFLFSVFMNRNKVAEVNKMQKKRGQYPAILIEQDWSIKNLPYLAEPFREMLSGIDLMDPSCPFG